jgi:hypothetical protein
VAAGAITYGIVLFARFRTRVGEILAVVRSVRGQRRDAIEAPAG